MLKQAALNMSPVDRGRLQLGPPPLVAFSSIVQLPAALVPHPPVMLAPTQLSAPRSAFPNNVQLQAPPASVQLSAHDSRFTCDVMCSVCHTWLPAAHTVMHSHSLSQPPPWLCA